MSPFQTAPLKCLCECECVSVCDWLISDTWDFESRAGAPSALRGDRYVFEFLTSCICDGSCFNSCCSSGGLNQTYKVVTLFQPR